MRQYGYKLEPDGAIVLTMTPRDYQGLMFAMGMCFGKMSDESKKTVSPLIILFDRLNDGNPNWNPYELPTS